MSHEHYQRLPVTLLNHSNLSTLLLFLLRDASEHHFTLIGAKGGLPNGWLPGKPRTTVRLFSAEKIPTAIERYEKEILRVLGVLDGVLAKRRWLVGDKCSAVDISFVTWYHTLFARIMKDYPGFDPEKDFPNVHRWHKEMLARPMVSKVFAVWEESFTW
ncbi:glutathione S-transferase [Ganoderma leucocontextum]|nr:glutathione S-transferase [Ganoderma leucocontextum]